METKRLTEKESLELISQMIQNTKTNIESGRGNPLLIWGLATLVSTAIVWVSLALTQSPYCYFLWFLIPIIGYPLDRLKGHRPEKVLTYIDKSVNSVWSTIGLVAVLAPMVMSFTRFAPQIPFVEILVVSIGVTITGQLIQYKMLTVGGVIGMLLAFCALFVSNSTQLVILFSVWSLTTLMAPGLALNRFMNKPLEKKNHV